MSKKVRPNYEWRKRHPNPEQVEGAAGTRASKSSKSPKSSTPKSE